MKNFYKQTFFIIVCLSMILHVYAFGQNEDVTREITVMVPPWAEPSEELLANFTDTTGISVILNIVGWDDIRNKVSIAAFGQTAPADVIEVDWSWVGEFGSASWFEPIVLSNTDIKEMPTVASFTYGGDVLALPYANDFRLAYYNTDHFSRVGLSQAPENWDALVAAAKMIKEDGICDYPLSMTLSASEAATTSLLWLTLSKYGNFFNEDFSVNKNTVLPALQTVNTLVKEEKLIDPASKNLKDVEVYSKLTSKAASFMIGPTYFIGRINNPEYSQIVSKASAMLVPGNSETRSATFALPEGLGISAYSENKDAALQYINWFTSPDVQVKFYEEKGIIPTRTQALQELVTSGKMIGGEVLIEQSNYIASPFPGGIPHWYSEMSNTIYNAVNKMVSGQYTPEKAYDVIEKKVIQLRNENK